MSQMTSLQPQYELGIARMQTSPTSSHPQTTKITTILGTQGIVECSKEGAFCEC